MRVGNQSEPVDGGGERCDVRGPRSGLHSAVGPAWQLVRHVDMIENPAHHEVHEFFDALGAVIEARGRREHDRAGSRQAQHVLEVNVAVRRLSRDDDELAALKKKIRIG